jgi:hypothetical protein
MWRANTIALEQVSALRRRMLARMFEQQQPKGLLVALGSTVDRLTDAFWSARSAHLPSEYRRDGGLPGWRLTFNPESIARHFEPDDRLRVCA